MCGGGGGSGAGGGGCGGSLALNEKMGRSSNFGVVAIPRPSYPGLQGQDLLYALRPVM